MSLKAADYHGFNGSLTRAKQSRKQKHQRGDIPCLFGNEDLKRAYVERVLAQTQD